MNMKRKLNRAGSQAGFSLLEAAIAIVMLSIGILSLSGVYAQGIVLGKKYRLLRLSYNIFMFGLILSVIAFIIASAFYGKQV